MGMTKNYQLALEMAGDTIEEQDAISYGMTSLPLTGNIEQDRKTVRENLPQLLETWRRTVRQQEAAEQELIGQVFGRSPL